MIVDWLPLRRAPRRPGRLLREILHTLAAAAFVAAACVVQALFNGA